MIGENDGTMGQTPASADDEDEVIRPKTISSTGVRQVERVNVKLRITLLLPDAIYDTESVDVSETGLLLTAYDGPPLTVGEEINVLIRGIVADGEINEQEAEMKVVRADDRLIALTFPDSQPKLKSV